MADDKTPTKVAIACQGGGSHTAFTAGVLQQILKDRGSDYEITALTGTSGGAMCAVLAWYGLRTGDEEKAIRLLDGFWTDLKASMPVERLVNEGFVWTNRLLKNGFPLWQVSPELNPAAKQGQQWLRRTLLKQLDGPPLSELIVNPDHMDGSLPSPTVLVSAVDVNDGGFDIFTDRPDLPVDIDSSIRDSEADCHRPQSRFERPKLPISVDAVLASAAVPPMFDAVELPGANGLDRPYWDGLLSQNPPVRNLLTVPKTKAEKPDEIWVIRINPTKREEYMQDLEAIDDRRNELAGSLSLRQELYFIEQVNTWLKMDAFTDRVAKKYKPVTVRQLELDEDRLKPPRHLVTSTKLDRDGAFISDLMELGCDQASEFLANPDNDQYVLVD
jgi:NTE family protein